MSDKSKDIGGSKTTDTTAEQQSKQPEQAGYQAQAEKPVSAMLARRLAGAASGYPNGQQVWFTARYERRDFRFDVSKAHYSKPSAPDGDSGVFGPYQTPATLGVKQNEVVRVTLHLSDGTEKEVTAKEVDCLFWSESAVEKFVIPYYGAIGDLELAMHIRSEFRRKDVAALCHGPNTEYCLQRAESTGNGFKVLAI